MIPVLGFMAVIAVIFLVFGKSGERWLDKVTNKEIHAVISFAFGVILTYVLLALYNQ